MRDKTKLQELREQRKLLDEAIKAEKKRAEGFRIYSDLLGMVPNAKDYGWHINIDPKSTGGPKRAACIFEMKSAHEAIDYLDRLIVSAKGLKEKISSLISKGELI